MTMVWVVVRHKDHQLNWRQLMDRDSAYFQDFRHNVEADLEKGCSITITPAEDINEVLKSKEERDRAISTKCYGWCS